MATNYTVVAVTQEQSTDAAGALRDYLVVNFTVPDRPGLFTVNVPLTGNVVADAGSIANALASEVLQIYAL